MANTIADMLAMETAEPDATLTPIEVFGEKSKDADDAQEEMMNLAMELAMGSTPIGGTIKTGKGVMSFLKGLLGKTKSKAKFPVGYGEPTRNLAKESEMLRNHFTKMQFNEVLNRISMPEHFKKVDRVLKRTPSKRTEEWIELQKALDPSKQHRLFDFSGTSPKGMRKVGVRVKD